jgi:hypothetical protein
MEFVALRRTRYSQAAAECYEPQAFVKVAQLNAALVIVARQPPPHFLTHRIESVDGDASFIN